MESDAGWQPWLGSMTDEVLAASGQLRLCILNIYHGGDTGETATRGQHKRTKRGISFIQSISTSVIFKLPFLHGYYLFCNRHTNIVAAESPVVDRQCYVIHL